MMKGNLANSATKPRDHYQVVVIGSGYGGSIMAARLAAAGYEVCLFERGRELTPGEFPDDLTQVMGQLRAPVNPLGLYDDRVTDDIDVLVGNGLGGTSLINANVLIKPDSDVFNHPRWPDEIRRESRYGGLNKYFRRVADMLQVASVPKGMSLTKLRLHRRSARERPGRFYKLKLAVNLDKYDDAPNHVGVLQKCCLLCGDCVTGCNVRAKNTLDMNYLPYARMHGAHIFTETEASYVSKKEAHGYCAHCTFRGYHQRTAAQTVRAGMIVLAAGTLGSTEILLRSRERGLAVSERLGRCFSGNGDMLGVGYNNDLRANVLGFGNIQDERARIKVGSTILSLVDYRNQFLLQERFIIEEVAFPRAFVDFLRYSLPKISVGLGQDTDFGGVDTVAEAKRIFRDLGQYDPKGPLNHSMVYLGMGHERADGIMALGAGGKLRIDGKTLLSRPIFDKMNREMNQLASLLGGAYIRNPRWSPFFGRNLITVHPLGGCIMGDSPRQGVVDDWGRVFDPSGRGSAAVHEGLFVVDGSIIPFSLGVNPLFTISALAEQTAERVIQD